LGPILIISIVGARPQFVKAALFSAAARRVPGLRHVLIHTGQHYDENMSDVFFDELGLPAPDHELKVGSGPHGLQTGRMMEAVEGVLAHQRPDWVVVYGDTNSTLAGALVASKLRHPLAHVEAGLRAFNKSIPEELNRIVADHVSTLLFAPTDVAVANLFREGLPAQAIVNVGDIMVEAAATYGKKAEEKSTVLARLGLAPKRYILGTVHRAENTDAPERLRNIFEGFEQVALEIPVVVPLHPRTRKKLGTPPGRVTIVDPVGYLDMARLERGALVVATDSGGVQKEAFFHRVPCAVLRAETEWTELVDLGWSVLVPPASSAGVAESIRGLIGRTGRPGSPYGDGTTSARIVERLARSPR
jgi:UDP-GlcNAc3NAcA epimerase